MAKPSYTLTDLHPAAYDGSSASDINEVSLVVGTVRPPGPPEASWSQTQAAKWGSGVPPELIGDATFTPSKCWAVNNSGQAVGFLTIGENAFENHGFLYSSGEFLDLEVPVGFPWIGAYDINDDGVIVGYCGSGTVPDDMRAFIWNSTAGSAPVLLADTKIALAIDAAGSVVGLHYNNNVPVYGFIFRNQQIQNLGQGVFPDDISNTNEWVSGWKPFGQFQRAFRLNASLAQLTLEDVGPPTAEIFLSHAWAINDDGIVVGSAMLKDDSTVPFVDFPASSPHAGWYYLEEVITNGAGWKGLRPTSINNKGEIVGSGEFQGQGRAFLLTPKPSYEEFEIALGKFEAAIMMLLGGVERGSGGTGITFKGKPIPIDPHDPLWRQEFRRNPDVFLAYAISRLASLSNNPQTGKLVDQTAREILHGAFRAPKKRE